jgi:hypothetical protein
MPASDLKLVAVPGGHTVISCGDRGPSTLRPVAMATGLVAQHGQMKISALLFARSKNKLQPGERTGAFVLTAAAAN